MERLFDIAPTRFDVPKRYYEDPRGRYRSYWRALVEPRHIEEVVGVVNFAREEGVPIVPYGGGSGLVGGQCFPDEKGAICLSLRAIRDIRIEGDSALVGAGVILDELHEALSGTGWRFPLSLASSGSAQIGGLVSTNAGGVNVIRFGNMGALIDGVEAVLADGSIIDGTRNLRKDNTGFALDRLMIGAEGTLGVITAARLRLVPDDRARFVVLAPVDHPSNAEELLAKLRQDNAPINAFELISGTGLRFRQEAGFEDAPIGFPDWAVLIDLAGAVDDLGGIADDLADAVIAEDEKRIAALWHIRETIPLANRHIGAIASHDIALPLDRVAEFIGHMGRLLRREADLRINCFGHLGDGNLHYNLFPQKGKTKADYDAPHLSHLVYSEVVKMGGSISAEHGIGRYKADMMARYGLADKQAQMLKIKRALDPQGIMNPGVFFPSEDNR